MDVGTSVFAVSCNGKANPGAGTLSREQDLNRFFIEVEKRALRIAEISVRDRDDALDLVQDAMIKLVRNYSGRSKEEWTPLFYRILQNGVRDWQRRQMVRNRVMVWFRKKPTEDNDYDPIAAAPDPTGRAPDEEALERHLCDGGDGCGESA